jgi:hypothetical protein
MTHPAQTPAARGGTEGTNGQNAAREIVELAEAIRSAMLLSPVPRLALSPSEAAAAIGISADSFYRHVRPDLRLVRRGRLVLVPVVELERWLDRQAARLGDKV